MSCSVSGEETERKYSIKANSMNSCIRLSGFILSNSGTQQVTPSLSVPVLLDIIYHF